MSKRTCSIDGCERPFNSKGLCKTHYNRTRRGVDVNAPIQKRERNRTCSIEGCDRKHEAHGLCAVHYNRLQRGADLLAPVQVRNPGGLCEMEGCDRPLQARGLCGKHYRRWQTHGDANWEPPPSGPRPCKVSGCDKTKIRAFDMCNAHYLKWARRGDPLWTPEPKWEDHAGERFGFLTVIERAEDRWLCQCDCGATKNVKSGDLTGGLVKSCGNVKVHWRTDSPGYGAVHDRLRRDRGRADTHACVDCGGTAREWSYNHSARNELIEVIRSKVYPFSRDLNDYDPRCSPCHVSFDSRP